jgi:hypothetical protein
MAGPSKRRNRQSDPSRPIEKPVDNEWEKEDEELELEQQLFGRSKKRVKSGPSTLKAESEDEDEVDMSDVGPRACGWGWWLTGSCLLLMRLLQGMSGRTVMTRTVRVTNLDLTGKMKMRRTKTRNQTPTLTATVHLNSMELQPTRTTRTTKTIKEDTKKLDPTPRV